MDMSFLVGPKTAPPRDAELRDSRRLTLVDPWTAAESMAAERRGNVIVLCSPRETRGAAVNKLAAAESGAKLARNSPTAEVARTAAELVLCGDTGARSSTASVALSPGHVAFATSSADPRCNGSRAQRTVASAALATKGGGE